MLIDTTPDLRQQALCRLDCGALTLSFTRMPHADHIMGLDDIRPFNYGREGAHSGLCDAGVPRPPPEDLPLCLRGRGGAPGGRASRDGASTQRSGCRIVRDCLLCRYPILHGPHTIVGFRFGRAAYLTDQSDIPERSLGVAGRPRCALSRRVTAHPASDAFDPRAGAGLGEKTQAQARVFHPHLSRSAPCRDNGRAA